MKKAWFAALVALAVPVSGADVIGVGVIGASRARAQDDGADMSFGEEETAPAGDGTGDGGADMSFGADEPTSDGTDDGTGGDVISSLSAEGEASGAEAAATERDTPVRAEEAHEEIYAVQQIYALRINRVELMPSLAQSLNDPFVSHTGVGIALNYWFTNVLAVGLNFIWYEGLESESDLNFFVRRGTRLAVPVNSFQFLANLNFTYVPVYGKFAMFNEFIFQYDAYIVGGVGLMRTRPIPVVDPVVRQFDFGERISFNVGIGLRVFVTRWLAVFAELRDYMYLETLENLNVELGTARTNRDTWVQPSPAFVNNVTAHIGLAVFIPFDFSYNQPR
jgi:outer membrane beta-barrel protein